MNKDTGGQAFPRTLHLQNSMQQPIVQHEDGMTLRDYLAGQAAMGLIADSENCMTSEEIATHAYQIADAMIKERSKPDEQGG